MRSGGCSNKFLMIMKKIAKQCEMPLQAAFHILNNGSGK